jgi:hypothetical protein
MWASESMQLRAWVAAIPEQAVWVYTAKLQQAYPGKVTDTYNTSQCMHTFHRRMQQKAEENCVFCAKNGSMDNVAMDSPRASEMAGCDHRACVECWRKEFKRQPAWFEHADCKVCGWNLAPFLKQEYAWASLH